MILICILNNNQDKEIRNAFELEAKVDLKKPRNHEYIQDIINRIKKSGTKKD